MDLAYHGSHWLALRARFAAARTHLYGLGPGAPRERVHLLEMKEARERAVAPLVQAVAQPLALREAQVREVEEGVVADENEAAGADAAEDGSGHRLGPAMGEECQRRRA